MMAASLQLTVEAEIADVAPSKFVTLASTVQMVELGLRSRLCLP
jgi:hypothetical protein